MSDKPNLRSTEDLHRELLAAGVVKPDEADYAEALILAFEQLNTRQKLVILELARVLAAATRRAGQ